MIEQKKYWPKDELFRFFKRWRAITIPVNKRIENDQVVLNLNQTYQVLEQAEKIALTDCVCRSKLQNCKKPRETCLFLDKDAEKIAKNGRGRFISKDRAKEIVLMTHEEGLVHLTMYHPDDEDKSLGVLCSCCACCCHALQGLMRMKMQDLVKPSEFIASTIWDDCINCGKCVDRCVFGARTQEKKKNVVFNQERCFGCGLCVTTCPKQAIELIRR
ncbi:MAG: ATP-binding protein [Candidatus Odinarchaeota archaeon]